MNEQDEYETVKKEIRSLLITFKNGCSLFEFKNQYQMIMGHELPFMKFGFKNEIEFLCTMPDVSQITLTDRGYHLKVVTDQNTKHIQKLVSKQKTDKRKSVSHSSPIQSVAPPHGFHESYTPSLRNETKTRTKKELPSSIVDEVVALVCKYHAGLNMLDVLQRYRCCYEKELPFTSYGFFTLEEFLEAIPQVILKKTDNDIYLFCSSKLEDACPRLVEMNNPTRMCSNTLGVDPKEHGVKGELEMYKTFMKTVKEVADKSKAPVLNKAVVSRFVRNALWEPRKKYGLVDKRSFDPYEKANVCEDANQPRIKHSTSKENDSPFKQKMECLDVFNVESSLDSGKIKTDPIQLLPPNAISPLKRLEQQRLPTRLVLGSLFSAYVSNILSPEHMYIQLGDEEQALSDMNHALEKFYTDSESKTFVMKDIHILPGSTGVAQWPLDMHWYRIRVMSVISDGSVKVFFVDYGTMDNISKTLLRYIREDFFSFPAQAMKASLAYVKPPRGFRTWSQRATDKILELSLDESVKAEVEDIEDDVLLLTLYNKNGIYINGVLLDEHLAQATSVESKHREPVDLSDVTSPARSTPARDWPPIISSPSTESRQLSSTSCGSQSLNENLSTCANFSKSFEAALTSAIAPSTCAISEISQKKLVFNETPSPPKEAAVNLSNSPPSSNSEVFDDDTDAFFEYFYQKVSAVTKRYVKRIRTVDGYVFHILIYGSKPYVSCGDISHLIWSNKDSEFMLRRLQNSGSLPASVLIWEDENVNMFDQLKRFHVKGCKVMNDRTCLLIFSLNNLVEILNKFGHPSVELRTKIIHEYSAFNPNHPTWKELSEVEFSDGEEEFSDRTDDDKLNRLCLYDLQVMKENIRIRCQRLKLQESRSVANEEQKLHLLHEKVMLRINEIQQICSNFSNT